MSDKEQPGSPGIELSRLLSISQLALLVRLLREVRKVGYGEVYLKIEGNRIYIIKGESFDGGILPKIDC